MYVNSVQYYENIYFTREFFCIRKATSALIDDRGQKYLCIILIHVTFSQNIQYLCFWWEDGGWHGGSVSPLICCRQYTVYKSVCLLQLLLFVPSCGLIVFGLEVGMRVVLVTPEGDASTATMTSFSSTKTRLSTSYLGLTMSSLTISFAIRRLSERHGFCSPPRSIPRPSSSDLGDLAEVVIVSWHLLPNIDEADVATAGAVVAFWPSSKDKRLCWVDGPRTPFVGVGVRRLLLLFSYWWL